MDHEFYGLLEKVPTFFQRILLLNILESLPSAVYSLLYFLGGVGQCVEKNRICMIALNFKDTVKDCPLGNVPRGKGDPRACHDKSAGLDVW